MINKHLDRPPGGRFSGPAATPKFTYRWYNRLADRLRHVTGRCHAFCPFCCREFCDALDFRGVPKRRLP